MNDIIYLGFNIDAWITIVTVVVLIAVLLLTRIHAYAAFLTAIGVLFVTGVLDAKETCSGFSSSAVVITGVLTVVMTGLRYTGVLQWTMKHVFGHPDSYPKALLRMMVPVAALSAFVNNTTATSFFSGIVKLWAKKLGIAPSKLYIPLAYIVLMGGVCTLIGTSSNIVISDLYQETTGKTMNMFAPLVPGAISMIVGMLFIIATRRWLPERKSPDLDFETTLEYTAELLVPSDNPFIGKTLGEAGLFHVKGGNLIELYRFDNIESAITEDEFVMGGDRLVYTGQIDEIYHLKKTHKLAVADHHIFSMSEVHRSFKLCTASVVFGSNLIGESIGNSTIEEDNNMILVAVARQGKRIEEAPREVILQAGDVLLFECPRKTDSYVSRLSSQLQFSDFHEVAKTDLHTAISSLIMIAMLLLTAMNVVSLLQGTVLAALAMLVCRCCNFEQAMNAINWRMLMSMAGSIVLGTAIMKTGIAHSIAHGILGLFGTEPLIVIIAICMTSVLITQLVMNVAVGAMFFPIMYEAALQTGYEPTPFIIALMIATNAAYMTPIAAPPNMMVYGPGGYRFSDFMRIGLPLTIIVTITGIVSTFLVFSLTRL